MRRRGFTLLEVILALAILVVGIAAILPLFALGTTSHKRGIEQTHVSMIAPHVFARIQERLTEANPPEIKGQEFSELGRTYLYDATFAPLDGSDAARSAFVVTVTIRWSERREERSEVFKSILRRRLPR